MFSHRLQSDLAPNRLAQALARARADGRPLIDFTESNPTRVGFTYPADLLAPLADRRGLIYAPDAFGVPAARAAVSGDFARRGLAVDPGRIVLTASTSEAYSLLFKVLCDPGDDVLVPRPSYPLFEHLTRLDGVSARPYELDYHGEWVVDFESLTRACSPRTRAVLVVSPNNPTGSFVKRGELDRLSEFSVRHQAAIVADEVFADYPLVEGASDGAAQFVNRREGLVFSLGGLSKSAGLPQIKVGWIAVAGESGHVRDAMTSLELACDSYLSVSTPAQVALPEFLSRAGEVRAQIQTRITTNYRALIRRAGDTPSCQALRSEGGWYGVVQVPSLESEEDLVIDLLERRGVLIHPGYFFDFPRESFLIISLLVPEPRFSEGIDRAFGHFDRSGGQ